MSTPPNLVIQQSILNKSRKDKFILVLTLPNILKTVNNPSQSARASQYLNQNSLQYSIFGTIVPNIAVPDVEVPFAGQVPKVTSYSRPAYPNITVGFTVDNGFNNWWVLWYWLDLINNSTESYYNANNLADPSTIKTVNGYQTIMTVYGLDEYNNPTIQFDYTNAFITGLGEINYDYKVPDQIESSFTFAFSQLKPNLL